ncbi:ABC transporter permease [Fulvivirga lutimaris]|uniref:ABC transporter permease n=1 Tax=Fulvivirga lutimaris TaxID=1819566 RepID=UPI001C87CF15|nr:ABC transporter permease [Fulvivirga lutimaris]
MKKHNPPIWADMFLEWYCSKNYIDEVQGDLYEWFQLRVEKQGLWLARLLYFLDVIRFMRSYRLKSIDELSQNSNNIAMLHNYLMTSWRSLTKNKLFSIINVSGLTVGITAFLLLWTYVQHERTYDQHLDNKENIFRIQQDRYNLGEITTQWAAGCGAIGKTLKDNFPEVESFVIMTNSNAILEYNEHVFREDATYYASEDFFKVFSINLIQGDPETVLKEPYKAVISESAAKKYFGEEEPIGKMIEHNGSKEFEIVGVYEDLPKKSHMQADLLYSFSTFVDIVENEVTDEWNWDGFYNYIVLKDGTDYKDFESKIADFIDKERGEELASSNEDVKFHLQPVTDIHLTSNYMMEFKPNGNEQATNFLFIIAFFIIIIAWVNYINLTTAKSMERSKEVGIRKVMGSMRGQLVKQFLVESFILNLVSLLAALLFIYLLLPYFNALTGRVVAFELLDPNMIMLIGGILVMGTLLSGLYPALVLSGFKPVAILKGKLKNSAGGKTLRKGMVVFQFFTSLVLMVGTTTVFYQLSYMNSQDLGVDINQTLVVRGPNVTDSLYSDKLNVFKHNLSAQSEINVVTSSTAVPGSQPDWNAGGIYVIGEDPDKSQQYRIIGGDYDYLEAFDIELAAGRNFEEERTTDPNTVILNESAAELMGFKDFEEALSKEIQFWGDTFQIVGVVKNYHNESLKKSFEPLIFRLIPNASNYYSVKVTTNNMPRTIATIEEEWKAQFPGNPFDFFFLDDHYQEQYKADQQFGQVFGLFAGLAIFIACLGLFGLASYMATQRYKEISVRKVLGATVGSVVTLLSRDFVILILIAIVLAIPVSWYVMDGWLAEFAYRIDMSWWLFALPGLTLIIIALATVSFQTIKVGTSNPVDALRSE